MIQIKTLSVHNLTKWRGKCKSIQIIGICKPYKMRDLHKILKKRKSTVTVSLAVQPCCVHRDINTRWEAFNPLRSLLVHSVGW